MNPHSRLFALYPSMEELRTREELWGCSERYLRYQTTCFDVDVFNVQLTRRLIPRQHGLYLHFFNRGPQPGDQLSFYWLPALRGFHFTHLEVVFVDYPTDQVQPNMLVVRPWREGGMLYFFRRTVVNAPF